MTGQWSDDPYWTPTCDRCGEGPRNCECAQESEYREQQAREFLARSAADPITRRIGKE